MKMETLLIKKDKAINMFEKLINNTNKNFKINKKDFNKQIVKPSFLK